MKRIVARLVVTSLVPAALAVGLLASVAHAQSTAGQPAMGGAQSGAQRMPHERPTADMIQRMQDGRIAMIKGALKLTDAQAKLWSPVEDQIRAGFNARTKAMQERDARQAAATPGTSAARPTQAERLERDSQRMTQQAEQAKAFATAYRPFFDSLTDDQKKVAEPLLAGLNGDHRGHGGGRRWAGGHHRDGAQQQ